ncbi:hypothetical protein O181_100366 [Austropuccinia psidii MF-1]|uniref:Uncharacterized protein n=1 Tax=Austropuccinia psidii MF-1 TaxID=1389203 RepID=A0A9Q3JEN7_9BASI|nr:hypothetical protein [Austropuccinia psidii MF-1]
MLGRRVPREGVDFISKNPQNVHQVIKQDRIKESRFFSIKVEIFSDPVVKIQNEVWQDKDYKEILKQLAKGESVPDYSLEPQAKLLLVKDRVIIPGNEEINSIFFKRIMTNHWLATLDSRRPSSSSRGIFIGLE